LSHRDAAALHAVRPSNGARIDVTTSAERTSTAKVRVHGRRPLDAQDVTTVAGIRTTTVARTLVDLAEVLAMDGLAKALSEAERQWKLDVRAIDQALARTRGRHGRGHAQLRAALAEHAAHGARLTKSQLEDRFVALLEAQSLPRPCLNAWIEDIEGDAVWPAAQLVVELDGWDSHKTRRAFQRDREKGNALLAAGWAVLRFTYRDVVRRPEEVAAQIAAQLSRAA
jgi:very-short-patch-repair endonuclease